MKEENQDEFKGRGAGTVHDLEQGKAINDVLSSGKKHYGGAKFSPSDGRQHAILVDAAEGLREAGLHEHVAEILRRTFLEEYKGNSDRKMRYLVNAAATKKGLSDERRRGALEAVDKMFDAFFKHSREKAGRETKTKALKTS